MPVSFEVSKVEPGTLRLDTIPMREAIHRLVSIPDVKRDEQYRKQFIYPPMLGYEGSSTGEVFDAGVHPFVGAVQVAFDAHLPLSLSPDHVWLLLAQGFANHVRLHAEQLRERFVAHRDKVLLTVVRHDFVRGGDNPWSEVFEGFTTQIREHVGKRCDLVVADFSTTGPLERTVSQLVLLDTMQGYFNYLLITRCGIPRITLTGTPADWRSLRTRAEIFVEFDLGWWVDPLRPILDEFVAAAAGRVDVEHWRAMYKLEHMSGGPRISGWLPVLFPYLYEHDWNGPPRLVRNEYVGGWRERMHARDCGPTTLGLPTAIACVPMIWDYYRQLIPMQLLAGFAGVRQDPATLEVSPQLGWAVREAPES